MIISSIITFDQVMAMENTEWLVGGEIKAFTDVGGP